MAFTTRQWCTLIVFVLSYIFCACIFSIQAPFYPAEAEKKGATPTEYGLVFGIYNLGILVLSPVYGKYMGKIGPKIVFSFGIFTSALSVFLFGFLDKIEGHIVFITLSFLLRITESVGSAAFITSSFTIIACEFPDSVATTFASLETVWGVGLIIGPSLGGALFELGGFFLPFVTIGVCLFITALMTCFLLPSTRDCTITDAEGNELEGYGLLKIIILPAVALSAGSITMGAASQGFLGATLEPLIRQFNFSPFKIGLVFVLNGISYGVAAPIWGVICDKYQHPKYVVMWGTICCFFSYIIIGPIAFMPFDTTFWVVCTGLVLNGIGIGAIQVSGFILALHDCIDNGFPDNVQTYGVVAAMWSFTLALGMFIGPSVGGFLLDHFGFRLASVFPLLASLLMFFWTVAYLIMSDRKRVKEDKMDEDRKLLTDLMASDNLDIPDVKIRSTYGSMED